jgi:hypothetical protein
MLRLYCEADQINACLVFPTCVPSGESPGFHVASTIQRSFGKVAHDRHTAVDQKYHEKECIENYPEGPRSLQSRLLTLSSITEQL